MFLISCIFKNYLKNFFLLIYKDSEINDLNQFFKHKNLTFYSLISFKDAIKKEAPTVISKLKKVGFEVKMITGDHKLSAISVAKECGILSNDEEIEGRILDGNAFVEKFGGVVCSLCNTNICNCPRAIV